ncbi:methyltransferase, FkbM family domain protein [Lyngbya aestuarii BL J]|uniref:Methyltransferase, FkbM family domain protein n=1 Tax=Lyngbya aestuarii BL J TaxID=1348334 RepID=U7QP51_9CYAN|nr:FkbM family methyltransferase [Lyngbya aestuarii]ERT08181.1 methyltransferase, FkbM family domain protein [Lyngbya aestuarii BL J]
MSYIRIGNEYLRQGKLDEAIEAYQTSIRLNPSFHWAYYKLGDAFKRKGQTQKAEEAYQKANLIKSQLKNNQFNTDINSIESYEKQIQEISQQNSILKIEIEEIKWMLSQIVNISLSQLSVSFDISKKQDRVLSNQILVEFFLDAAKLLRPNYFFDIGSRDGSASIAVKKAVHTVKCYAFEGNINNYETFKDKEELEQLSIDYRYLAVTNYNGTTDFHIPTEIDGNKLPKNIGNASVMIRETKDCQYQTTRVNCTKLDDFCLKNNIELDENQNLALWIDVEGAALQVLEGAKKCLAQTSLILIEVEEYQYWNNSALADRIINELIFNNFIPVTRDFERLMQYNLLFVHSKYLNPCKGLIYKYFSKFKRSPI